MVKALAAILAVILLVASTAGTFYIARAQDQQPLLSQVAQGRASSSTTTAAKITVSNDNVQAGAAMNITGRNFDASSQISIYFMSARQADFAKSGRSALILQKVGAATNENDVQSNVDLTAATTSSFFNPAIIPTAADKNSNNNNNNSSSSGNDILGNALKALGG